MYSIEQTEDFKKWLKDLKDPLAKIHILKRIKRAEAGNFGDSKALGDGLSEMRITTGKGYRIYYMQVGNIIYLIISGGDKSTQQKDIDKAKAFIKQGK